LAQRSDRLPRTIDDAGLGTTGQLWEIVLLWLLEAGERLLRSGLLRDYSEVRDTLSVVRGQVEVVSAVRRYYAGTLQFDCAFEDHVENNPPNRILRAAAVHAAAAPLPESVRRRALRLVARFDNVGPLNDADWQWRPDRRSAYYRVPVTLAKHVLRSVGRDLAVGSELVWTFLIRTPELIEDGVRSVLQEALGISVVTKEGVRLQNSWLTFNPDLRFSGNRAVADIKYKMNSDWNRPDLYQVLAFAAALRCFDAAILNFTTASEVAQASLDVGDHRLCQLSWPSGATNPTEAALAFARAVRSWFDTSSVRPISS
jgi:5-methylcytosine-specific restriction enzyme subunit McrC